MHKNIVIVSMASLRKTAGRQLILSGCLAAAFFIQACSPSCSTTNPATPTLISIQGHGTSSSSGQSNVGIFSFQRPAYNSTSRTYTHYIGSTVRFSVPYPTSIELAINGKPLTKVSRPLTRNYEYAGNIDNPGGNPAIWAVDILTPIDVPYSTDYKLTIVDVSGSNRSQPLTVIYKQPVPIPTGRWGGIWYATINNDPAPKQTLNVPGPCAGGTNEQLIHLCLRNPPFDPMSITTSACSYEAAAKAFQVPYPDWRITPGPCSS